MSTAGSRWQVINAAIAVVGTGLAFAFLQAGAFRDLGADTLRRMLSQEALRAAALGASVTALLIAPLLVWQKRKRSAGSR